uniref:Tyrosinase_Cu-bd domain-containing protein n=1 Tax=Strongyloides venezuelensis TaxID=75913 RepID=A0A0K0EYH4_STRVS
MITKELPKIFGNKVTPTVETINQCMDINCLCYFIGTNNTNTQITDYCLLSNGKNLTKSVRKELRMLTTEERERYHKAVKQIKDYGDFTNLAIIHSQVAENGSAHGGPSFLPWHREFLKRYEIILKQIDPSITVPYWDSTLECELPTPSDSIIFTDLFFGTTDNYGNVITGPFKNFTTINGDPYIVREIGKIGYVFKDSEIDYILNQKSIDEALIFLDRTGKCPVKTDSRSLEYVHANIHNFIGGHMFLTVSAGNDPIFWNHHSFVDSIWEMWRKKNQNREEREKIYPEDRKECFPSSHFRTSLMQPFEEMRNIDGFSNKYTDNMYEYAPRPTCSPENTSCGSEFLFCKVSNGVGKCTAKVKSSGNCTGLEDIREVCYMGKCINGTCFSDSSNPIKTQKLNATLESVISSSVVK